uniref:Zinc finger CCCH domain-containing protein 6 n=1 Tax=Panagrellus redivivus TaxID=6233 RepID=A0A7E4VKJ4_PANRE
MDVPDDSKFESEEILPDTEETLNVEQENIPADLDAEMPETSEKECTSPNSADVADVEDGELPEDGEIMDEEEDKSHRAPEPVSKENKVIPPYHAPAPSTNGNSRYEHHESLKRHAAPSPDHYSKRPAISPDRYGPPVQLPPRRRQAWTESVLCKFFREGYCRDGDNCAYSHNAAHSNRKSELCKFYQQGFCKKGLACTLLHGEYPCKDFFKGQCSRQPCKYSHVPLNEFTKAIFDRVVQDETLASQIIIPQQPARRRVLLPRPAPSAQPEPRFVPEPHQSPYTRSPQAASALSPPMDNRSPNYGHHAIPPAAEAYPIHPAHPEPRKPELKVADDFVAMTSAEDPDEALFADDSIYNPMNNNNFHSYAPEPVQPYVPETSAPAPAANVGGLSITDMFNQISNEPATAATPTVITNFNSSLLDTSAVEQPKPKEVVYKLLPLEENGPDYDDAFMKKITNERFKEDPRVERIILKKFEHDSLMFNKNLVNATNQPKPAATVVAVARDPRLRGGDPRLNRPGAPAKAAVPAAPLPVAKAAIPVPVDVHDKEFQSLVEKQLAMVNQTQQLESRPPAAAPQYDPHAPSPSQYDSRPRYEGDRRHYEEDSRAYNEGYEGRPGYDRGGYSGGYDSYNGRSSRFEDDYRSYDDADRYRGPPRYAGRGRGRGYEGGDRFHGSRHPSDRYESQSRWDRDSHRRDYRERDRRDYGPPRREAGGRFRDRSRSPPPPRRGDLPMDDRSMKRKYDYQGPVRA